MRKISYETLTNVKKLIGNFELGQTIGLQTVYFRFGYWKQVDVAKLQEVIGSAHEVVEEGIYDDDCGVQYYYKLL